MEITLVAAVARNGALGKNNQLLWRLPDDLKHFKQRTLDGVMLMGRKTFESLPGLLPGRIHWVLTRQPQPHWPAEVRCFDSIQKALSEAKDLPELLVIGGAEIYSQMLPYATRLVYTAVETSAEADAFFPAIDWSQWEQLSHSQHPIDARHAVAFQIGEYRRIKP